MSSKDVSLVGRRRNFGSDVADAPIRTGVMFGGLRPVAFDPELDPPPGACLNCHARGHRRIECPQPQVSLLCHNCGRRGVTLDDCPRCSARHRVHLARIREEERARKQAHARDERELLKATRELSIAHTDDSSIGPDSVLAREYPQREDESWPKLAPEKPDSRACAVFPESGTVSVEMPSGRGGRESRRQYRASRPPCAKRTRADSSSRKFYFTLDRDTSDGEHENYSSRETVYVSDTREKMTVGSTSDGPAEETRPQRKFLVSDNGNKEESDSIEGENTSYVESTADENNENNENNNNNNNTSTSTGTWNDGNYDNGNKKPSPRSDGSNWRAESDAEQSDTALACNLSARAVCSGSARGNNPPSQRSAEIKGDEDLKKFLELVRKMSELSVDAQDLVIRQVVAERERLLGAFSVGIGDPVQEFLDLVGAIAHLPIGTQNNVLFRVVVERDLMARLHAA